MKQRDILRRTKEVIENKNFFRAVYDAIKFFLEYFYYRIFKSTRFKFQNKTLKYFYYPYNASWRNERAIEIPIALDFLKRFKGKKVLEVGNVLSHYTNVNHTIIDKYEKGFGVLNKDILNFKPKEKYDLIITISTLEHIGWDETPKNRKKVIQAINHLKKLLNKKGIILATIPLGWNPNLDNFIKEKKIKFNKIYLYKRISKDNKWIEINTNQIGKISYNSPFRFANGLVIGIIKKS